MSSFGVLCNIEFKLKLGCMQWLVTKRARQQWEKYNRMLSMATPTIERANSADAQLSE